MALPLVGAAVAGFARILGPKLLVAAASDLAVNGMNGWAGKIISKIPGVNKVAMIKALGGQQSGTVSGDDLLRRIQSINSSSKTDKQKLRDLDSTIKMMQTMQGNGGSAPSGDPELYSRPSAASSFVNNFMLPVVGDVASFAGNAMNTRNALLANALMAVSQPNGYRSGATDDMYQKFMPMVAAGLNTSGGVAKLAGDTIANRMYNYSSVKSNEDKNAAYLAYVASHYKDKIPGEALSRTFVNPTNTGSTK